MSDNVTPLFPDEPEHVATPEDKARLHRRRVVQNDAVKFITKVMEPHVVALESSEAERMWIREGIKNYLEGAAPTFIRILAVTLRNETKAGGTLWPELAHKYKMFASDN